MNQIHEGTQFDISATQQHRIGELMELADGRKYRYAKAGGTGLAVGKLMQASAELTNHANMAVGAAAAIGAKSLSVTPGATAGDANLYSEGYLLVNDATGEGHMYKVKGHGAITASTAFTIQLEEPLEVALTTSSEVTLLMNPWKNIVVYPTTATSGAAGVTPVAVTAAYYFWLQTHGPCNVLNDGALTVGSAVSPSNAVAGAVENGVIAQGFVGYALQTGVDTEYRPIFLTIE